MFRKILTMAGMVGGITVTLITAQESAIAQVYISGPQTGTLVDTTYFVTDTISVPEGETLVIEPGATLIFCTSSSFTVSGNLQAVGTATDSIRFMKRPYITNWGGLDFESSSDSSYLEFCDISGSNSSGIYLEYANITISHCSLRENWTPFNGGGIYCNYSNPHISDCSIVHNGGFDFGGGICCFHSSPEICGCLIVRNYPWDFQYGYGGGVWCLLESHPRIENCLISGNFACRDGSGLHASSGCQPRIINCTIVDNASVGFFYNHTGRGVYLQDAGTAMVNCIVRGNTPHQLYSEGRVIYSDIQGGYSGTGNISDDPLFVSGPEGDFYLSQIAAGQTQQSPCVDAGDPASPMISGTTRTDGVQDSGVVDMGFHYPLPSNAIFAESEWWEVNQSQPTGYMLSAHPNPFNPSTAIGFALPEAARVTLAVYDVNGRSVVTLANGWQEAGLHQATFDGSKFPSGIYFARLRAGDFQQTQKLILLK